MENGTIYMCSMGSVFPCGACWFMLISICLCLYVVSRIKHRFDNGIELAHKLGIQGRLYIRTVVHIIS